MDEEVAGAPGWSSVAELVEWQILLGALIHGAFFPGVPWGHFLPAASGQQV